MIKFLYYKRGCINGRKKRIIKSLRYLPGILIAVIQALTDGEILDVFAGSYTGDTKRKKPK